MNIKETLIKLNVCIDNEYLDKYCELIERNKNTKSIRFETQRHHIIPRFTKSNIHTTVVLTHKDHAFAHYYLYKCTTDKYMYSNTASLCRVFGGCWKNFDNNKFGDMVEEYTNIRKEMYKRFSRDLKGKNCGKDNISSKRIEQYDLEGHFIKLFYGSREAERKTGVSSVSIIACCKNKLKRAGMFQWKYADDNNKIIKKITPNCVIIYQYDNKGNLIAKYNSISEASRKSGYSYPSIKLWLTKPMKWNKYIWKTEI